MIIDAHCHAWRVWPYDMAVPDFDTRGSASSLLYEMEQHGVDHAVTVAACIGGGKEGDGRSNSDNNEYLAEWSKRYPDLLSLVIDVDSRWSDTYHHPGAADRLAVMLDEYQPNGFTHYLAEQNDGWFQSQEAREWFEVASAHNAFISLSVRANWLQDLAKLAAQFPAVPVMINHLGLSTAANDRAALVGCATVPSFRVKLSGLNRLSQHSWQFPYSDVHEHVRLLRNAFGSERLHWGSDFPASRDMLTYRQSIEVIHSMSFLTNSERDQILAKNTADLLAIPIT